MTTEEIIKKAKELGLSEEEISKFIENESIAKKYGFEDEYSSVNVKIDKKKQSMIEAGASDEILSEEDECDCGCEDCHCGDCECEECDCDCECECDDDCCCHHHHHE